MGGEENAAGPLLDRENVTATLCASLTIRVVVAITVEELLEKGGVIKVERMRKKEKELFDHN